MLKQQTGNIKNVTMLRRGKENKAETNPKKINEEKISEAEKED